MTATRSPRQPQLDWVQLSLTGEDDVTKYRRDEVLAINVAHTTNGERVADLARLGYLVHPVLDPTYGYGNMWTHYQPEQLYAGDLNPEKVPPTGNGIVWHGVLDFRSLPFEDRHFGSTLYDPPYRHAGTPTQTDDGDHDDRYGTDTYRTKAEQLALILDGAHECGRVTDQYLVIKAQDQVVAGTTFFQTHAIINALAATWELHDRLLLISYRAQPDGRTQKNARNNISTFLVFGRRGPVMIG